MSKKPYKKTYYFVLNCCDPEEPEHQMTRGCWWTSKTEATKEAKGLKHSYPEDAFKVTKVTIEVLDA